MRDWMKDNEGLLKPEITAILFIYFSSLVDRQLPPEIIRASVT